MVLMISGLDLLIMCLRDLPEKVVFSQPTCLVYFHKPTRCASPEMPLVILSHVQNAQLHRYVISVMVHLSIFIAFLLRLPLPMCSLVSSQAAAIQDSSFHHVVGLGYHLS